MFMFIVGILVGANVGCLVAALCKTWHSHDTLQLRESGLGIYMESSRAVSDREA